MTFAECVTMCAAQPGLVAQYDRLTGNHLGALARRTPLEIQIDQATGFEEAEVAKFAAFVYECVWTRIPKEPS